MVHEEASGHYMRVMFFKENVLACSGFALVVAWSAFDRNSSIHTTCHIPKHISLQVLP
jgi:hypothetical protein